MKHYMAVDQHGQTYHDLGPYPRKALMELLGRKHVSKMYIDKKDGSSAHIGYVIGGLWLTVYQVTRMDQSEGTMVPSRLIRRKG